jgi:hypothetical protein
VHRGRHAVTVAPAREDLDFPEPLDALQALVLDMGLDLHWTRAGAAPSGFWKARRGTVLVELGKTPEELLERLRELDSADRERRRVERARESVGGA